MNASALPPDVVRSPGETPVRILVVIVNYRTPTLVVDCVRSLDRLQRSSSRFWLDVIVVDNCSGDGSVSILSALARSSDLCIPVELIQSAVNGGFAYGNNVALRSLLDAPGSRAGTELVWLLNPDTHVPESGLEAIVDLFKLHPEAAIAGNRILDENGDIFPSAFRRPTLWSEIENALGMGPVSKMLERHVVAMRPLVDPAQVDWVSGASMFLRAGAIKRLGLLDDEYFMYFEETDYCLAAARQGFQVWHCPSFQITHLLGRSSGVTGPQQSQRRRPRYWFESRMRFFRKNYSGIYLHAANLAWLLAYPLGRLWLLLRRRRSGDPPRLWLDFIAHNYLTRA